MNCKMEKLNHTYDFIKIFLIKKIKTICYFNVEFISSRAIFLQFFFIAIRIFYNFIGQHPCFALSIELQTKYLFCCRKCIKLNIQAFSFKLHFFFFLEFSKKNFEAFFMNDLSNNFPVKARIKNMI